MQAVSHIGGVPFNHKLLIYLLRVNIDARGAQANVLVSKWLYWRIVWRR